MKDDATCVCFLFDRSQGNKRNFNEATDIQRNILFKISKNKMCIYML